MRAASGDQALVDAVTGGFESADCDEQDQAVLNFAAKMTRNAYKVYEADAGSFHAAGLSDEAYVEVVETVSIQTSLDRLTNALGVAPDAQPVLSYGRAQRPARMTESSRYLVRRGPIFLNLPLASTPSLAASRLTSLNRLIG